MALGRNPRMEGRRPSSSSYCSTVTLVLFVGLCMVGIWMMTSSAVVPVDITTSEAKSDVKSQVQTDMPFEDSPGDVPEGQTKAESATDNNDSWGEGSSEASTDQKLSDDQTVDFQEEAHSKGNVGTRQGSDDASPAQIYNDADGNQGQGPIEDVEEGVVTKTDATQDPFENGNNGHNPTEASADDKQQSENEKKSDSEDKFDAENTEGKVEENQEIKTENKSVENRKNEQTESGSDAGGESDGMQDVNIDAQIEEKVDEKQAEETVSSSVDKIDNQFREQNSSTVFHDDAQVETLNETNTQNGAWSTQATESKNEKKAQETISSRKITGFSWKLCSVSAGSDYIPCLDNENAIKKLRSTKHYEHRERHCPEEGPTCLVPLPEGYRQPIKWPVSRDKIWYFNVPHTKLAVVKGHQNWVKVTGEYLTFPGGGTQFKHGALHYIDFIQEILPGIAWGKRSRVILDVGCGVASFGGYLFERDVLTMSFAPKDEHEAQVQFALERGIPAISAVMGTKRLPFPSLIFDVVHCARCRVPWHIEGGKLLLELNRLLRPGGHFVWSATPVYQKLPEDVEIWNAMSELTKSMCWDLVTTKKDTLNGVGVAIYRKPSSNQCYDSREKNDPPLCQESDDRDAAWNISLQACMHRVPVGPAERGSQWPERWPQRLEAAPYWLNSSQMGVYGKPAAEDFRADYEHWKHVVSSSYLSGMDIDWSNVRNVMDMRSIYGGFGAALRDISVWVMNVVPIDSPDTLPIIYERGLFGMYHDWCESFSTYPRSYDLLHADHLFSNLKKRCKLLPVMAEVDRILRPEGYLIIRDNKETVAEVEEMARSLHYEAKVGKSKGKEGLLWMKKTTWRPTESEANAAATTTARASSTS